LFASSAIEIDSFLQKKQQQNADMQKWECFMLCFVDVIRKKKDVVSP
jgi:hypothetical protein